ncbi:MAG: division plane positioning ATPase MipZ, partial [Hyphomonas sp.]|nr:division plane positioning ATPase MipZ [Hyphomonas sp.]
IGFRVAPGLSERVIYRELFPAGLTLLDLSEKTSNVAFTMSHKAARQELRDLVIVLQLPELAGVEITF